MWTENLALFWKQPSQYSLLVVVSLYINGSNIPGVTVKLMLHSALNNPILIKDPAQTANVYLNATLHSFDCTLSATENWAWNPKNISGFIFHISVQQSGHITFLTLSILQTQAAIKSSCENENRWQNIIHPWRTNLIHTPYFKKNLVCGEGFREIHWDRKDNSNSSSS